MVEVRPGLRLRSAVDSVEVMVVKAPSELVDLRCGGQPMVPSDGAPAGGVPAAGTPGTLIGKRYQDESGSLEVLCTRPGPSQLTLGDVPLVVKEAKPLPASD
jgi:hypothetical protein